jgi:hypothetical protein
MTYTTYAQSTYPELDRSLPEHARERRRERRTTERLSLIATLGR